MQEEKVQQEKVLVVSEKPLIVFPTLEEAMEKLKFKEGTDQEAFLRGFEIDFWVRTENKEFSDLGNMIRAKNVILRSMVEAEVGETGIFSIKVPFENPCRSCGGTGEKYRFYRKVVRPKCKTCGGTGEFEDVCKSCKGTGRFVKDSPGLKIDVECKTCGGSGKYKGKCFSCRGKGFKAFTVIDSKIKSTTFCKTCRGRGFFNPRKETEQPAKVIKPANPVISEEIAAQLNAEYKIPDEERCKV
jgi:hypothetical protein